jgi:hypothetical protein
VKRIDIRTILALVGLAAILGIANNFRVAPGKRVSWLGGQTVLPGPEEAR